MRFELRYPDAPPHEVELQGSLAVIGRDPTCDLVVNDVKCSRRHAVLEAGPDGITIRDTGSANGVFVNGRKVERQALKEGDVVALGDVELVVLAEEMLGTLVMGPDEAAGDATTVMPASALRAAIAPPPPVRGAEPPPPPPPAPAGHAATDATIPPPAASSPATEPPVWSGRGAAKVEFSGTTVSGDPVPASAAGRPLTVMTLAILWLVSALLYLAGAVASALMTGGLVRVANLLGFGLLAIVGGAMCFGLWKLQSWARVAQIVLAGIGLLTCSFTLASGVTLFYMFRPGVRTRFTDGVGLEPKEGVFTGALLATVLLGGIVSAVLWALVVFGLRAAAAR